MECGALIEHASASKDIATPLTAEDEPARGAGQAQKIR